MAFSAYGQSLSRQLMAAFTLALLPLLAEAALTFLVCRRYLLHKLRPPATSIPASITSILLINVFLTLLLLCSVLGEGMIVSAVLFFQQTHGAYYLSDLAALLPPEAQPTVLLSGIMESSQMQEEGGDLPLNLLVPILSSGIMESSQRQEEGGDLPLNLLALAMVWVVVLAYVGVAVSIGLHVGCRNEGENEKNPWNMQVMRGMMRVVDRSKWVGLCLAVVFSTWACFHGDWHSGVLDRGLVEYPGEWRWQSKQQVVAFLLAMVNSERVWRWTAASSMLILLAVVSLYTIAARLALYLCCKRFSLQLADAEPLISLA